jgi:exosortase A-associated hydrolase 1
MRIDERPFLVDVEGDRMLAIVTIPAAPARIGVAIVVGGPQYRVGSHRQFVHLARALAAAGVPCLRFDYRGMGDSEGPFVGFTGVSKDIRAALDGFFGAIPGLEQVVLWGLCDGATAAAFYAGSDERVAGLTLFNPWVRTTSGAARTALTHYYARRIVDPAFWRKLAGGRVRWGNAARDLKARWTEARASESVSSSGTHDAAPLPARFADAIGRFAGPVLLGMSGNDLVAREFQQAAHVQPELSRAVETPRVRTVEFPGIDHTFSRAAWRASVTRSTLEWLRGRFPGQLEAEARPANGLMEVK